MSDTAAVAARYVMGHSDSERRRLQLQASVLNPMTEQLFLRAGIGPGMHVLDIGSGVGDVALISARLVGPGGSVTAVDIDPIALAIASERAAAEGLENINCIAGDVMALDLPHTFDAVTGRHILIHLPDPAAMLRGVAPLLKPGGRAVFQEYDFDVFHPSWPELPLRDRVMKLYGEFFAKLGKGSMGARLWSLFAQAGLNTAECRAEHAIAGGPESPFYEIFAESVRPMLPRAVALGIPGAAEIDIDTLEQRLREECLAKRGSFAFPTMVGAFAVKP